MPSHPIRTAVPEPVPSGEFVAMFVCPGARDVPIDHAIFPHGGGFSGMQPCPAREICAWYAEHDLGGEIAFNEQPESALLPGQFRTMPFGCAHYFPHTALERRSCRGRRCARRALENTIPFPTQSAVAR